MTNKIQLEDVLSMIPVISDGEVAIYRLFNSNSECVYVGQSSNLRARLCAHLSSAKVFDRVEFSLCDPESADEEEADAICRFQPLENKVLPTTKKYTTIRKLSKEIASIIESADDHMPVVFTGLSSSGKLTPSGSIRKPIKYIPSEYSERLIEAVKEAILES